MQPQFVAIGGGLYVNASDIVTAERSGQVVTLTLTGRASQVQVTGGEAWGLWELMRTKAQEAESRRPWELPPLDGPPAEFPLTFGELAIPSRGYIVDARWTDGVLLLEVVVGGAERRRWHALSGEPALRAWDALRRVNWLAK